MKNVGIQETEETFVEIVQYAVGHAMELWAYLYGAHWHVGIFQNYNTPKMHWELLPNYLYRFKRFRVRYNIKVCSVYYEVQQILLTSFKK